MSTFDELFMSDPDKSLNGIEIPVGLNQKGEKVIFWIAEAGNENHEKVQQKYSEELELTRHNDDLYQEVILKIIAESILVSWSGVIDNKGKAIKPTVENKIESLTKYNKLYHKVMQIASDESKFRDKRVKVSTVTAKKDSEKN